jgi:hypothetical protein
LVGFLDGLKRISDTTYKDLHATWNSRFHKVNFDDKNVNLCRKEFKFTLVKKEELLKDEELPTLYQFDLTFAQEARAFGFLFKGVFYLVWYDIHHIIYKKK